MLGILVLLGHGVDADENAVGDDNVAMPDTYVSAPTAFGRQLVHARNGFRR